MPWPAPDLPINFSNSTVSLDTHPGAHNATNLALNNNYKPELSRVGTQLAGTQSVYRGTSPTADADIRTDGRIVRTNNANSLPYPIYMAADGGYQYLAQADTGASSTGPTVVTYFEMTVAGDWTRGGQIDLEVACTFKAGTTTLTGQVVPGYRTNGATTPTYISNTFCDDVYMIANSGDKRIAITRFHMPVSPGTTNVIVSCGVRDSGGGLGLGKAWIKTNRWFY